MSSIQRSTISAGDVVRRIGGDEFLTYLPEVENEDAALRKAEKRHAAMGLLTPEQGAPPITCSIGTVVSPTVLRSIPICSAIQAPLFICERIRGEMVWLCMTGAETKARLRLNIKIGSMVLRRSAEHQKEKRHYEYNCGRR